MHQRFILPLAAVAALSVAAAAHAASSKTVTMNLISAQGVGAAIGTITLEDSGSGLVIMPDLKGLPPGAHGFHLHAKPSCAPGPLNGQMAAGIGAGGHFDPAKTGKHRGPTTAGGHKGDLPLLNVAADGTATGLKLVAPHLKLSDVVGHAFVIHAGGDNYADQPKPLGGGGARIACGVAM